MFKDNLGKSPFCQYTKYEEIERRLGKKISAVVEQLMQEKISRRE